ncbi:MAG: hypothetical protein ACJ8FS_01675 [Sphingomicrobium sp.]
MRPLLAIIYPAALLLSTAAVAAPDFAPNPRQAYVGFVAINPPRAEVPVGALWIDGYGPTGAAADKDNLETLRSLNSLTIDKNLQLALSVGLLDLIGIDPKLRDHYVAHFTDLSMVRVKDISKLAGPKGEPRIIEALKAGSVTISSDSDFGLNAQSIGFQKSNVNGSTSNDRARTYSIEAHDMFVAIHVATPELVASPERELHLSNDLRSAQIDDFLILISREKCAQRSIPCRPSIGVVKENSFGAAPLTSATDIGSDFSARLSLPVPIADGKGGLFDSLLVRWVASCPEARSEGCRDRPRLFARYAGTRLADLASIRAKSW